MSNKMETTDRARILMQRLRRDRIVPADVQRPSINRQTAYYFYRTLGPTRSLAALARELERPGWEGKVSMAKLREWSRIEDWPRACEAWDTQKADTHEYKELAELVSVLENLTSIMNNPRDDGAFTFDLDAFLDTVELELNLIDRVHKIRETTAAQAQTMPVGRYDPQETGGAPPAPSYVCGSRDSPVGPEQAEEAWQNGDSQDEIKPHDNALHETTNDEDQTVDDAWYDVEEIEDDTVEMAATLADQMGCYLPELPEEYRDALGPDAGVIRSILVSKADGFVVLKVNTDKPAWFAVPTDVRCR
jgi:hypothetical protein